MHNLASEKLKLLAAQVEKGFPLENHLKDLSDISSDLQAQFVIKENNVKRHFVDLIMSITSSSSTPANTAEKVLPFDFKGNGTNYVLVRNISTYINKFFEVVD